MSVTKVREKTAVQKSGSSISEIKGICATCMHNETCTYPNKGAERMVFCEEFEIEKAPHSNSVVSHDEVEELPRARNLKGLCVNCANLGTCTFPKPESGVWHCEEYR